MSGSLPAHTARIVAALLCVFSFVFASLAFSQPTSAVDPVEVAWQAADAALQSGPATITLRDQATIALPAGYGFVPPKQGAALMSALGNQTGDQFLGLILPTTQAQWFVTLDFDPAGYIKDDEAKDWNADELLKTLQDGTEAGNERRREMGLAAIEVTRWVEKPAYDAGTRRLVWSAEIRDKGSQGGDTGVNYNTYVLGREGYVSLNLVTSTAAVEQYKPAARELLAAVNFNDGKRYTDFNSSTDKVAAYGLAALVGGVALKKLGLIAAAGLFFAKFAKLILVGAAVLGGGIAKLFKGRGSAGPEA